MNEFVSILIPCYNAERWIAGAIESALAQTWHHKEIIVVDDGSTDQSLHEIMKFGDRVRCEAGAHAGGNATRNRLLELAKGKWLQYLDADDYLLPDKIEQQMKFLEFNENVDLVFGPVTLEYCSHDSVWQDLRSISSNDDIWVLLASWRFPQTGAVLWRKQAITDVGGWKVHQPCCQEHELYLRLMISNKKFSYCPSNGAIYRQWSESTVCNRDIVEVNRHRLIIENRLEDHLRQTKQLTVERLYSINQTRFKIARKLWHYDKNLALNVIKKVQTADANFLPSGPAAPARYQMIYRWMGFRITENLASLARTVLRKFHHASTYYTVSAR